MAFYLKKPLPFPQLVEVAHFASGTDRPRGALAHAEPAQATGSANAAGQEEEDDDGGGGGGGHERESEADPQGVVSARGRIP